MAGQAFRVGVSEGPDGLYLAHHADDSVTVHVSWEAAAAAAIRGPEVAVQDALYGVEGEVACVA